MWYAVREVFVFSFIMIGLLLFGATIGVELCTSLMNYIVADFLLGITG